MKATTNTRSLLVANSVSLECKQFRSEQVSAFFLLFDSDNFIEISHAFLVPGRNNHTACRYRLVSLISKQPNTKRSVFRPPKPSLFIFARFVKNEGGVIRNF